MRLVFGWSYDIKTGNNIFVGKKIYFVEIEHSCKRRKLGILTDTGERYCDVCEHNFPSQLKFANHLRRKDEFGRLCRPPPGKASNFLSGIVNYTQDRQSNSKKTRRIGIIRKGTH